MRLMVRRARAAGSLLVAAAGATLIATVLLTGLTAYGRQVVDAGARSAVGSAGAEERSVLVRGSAGANPAELAGRDAALRERVAAGLGGAPTRVSAAGYATGRQLTGPVGAATGDRGGAVYASVVFLDGLPAQADLVSGSWPRAGAPEPEVALAEPAAKVLGLAAGDRVPVTDRATGRESALRVAAVWRPRDVRAGYWRLSPGVADGAAPQSATYGPFVVHRDDFLARFGGNASAAWLLEPELAGADLERLDRVRRAVTAATATLPREIGLGSSGLATSRLDQLVDRLQRAELVGRSALVTPVLLVTVLGGYALLLVALLLTESRRGETALLRARGAARWQVAGLAAREAALVVLPAAVLAPLLAATLVGRADDLSLLTAGALRLEPRVDPLTWLAAAVAAAGCGVAMLVPTLRRGGTYVAEMASRSRPGRFAVAQRAGIDLALIVLAVLGWTQLRQYSSPLTGAGVDGRGTAGIDPLLAATPTLGVLAGAVLALRLLPPVTRFAERYVQRRSWTATMLGMWQAGRRPHAGPVLLLALAVAVSTLAWCLAGTAERSLTDQADHAVGADLRVVEADGFAPAGRAGELAGVPGVAQAVPLWRDSLRAGPESVPTTLLAVDAAAAPGVIRLRGDLGDGPAERVFGPAVAGRPTAPLTDLPAGTRRLTGAITTRTTGQTTPAPVRTNAVLVGPHGAYLSVALGAAGNGEPLRFAADLPAAGGPLRLAGFSIQTVGPDDTTVEWRLTGLRAETTTGSVPVDLAGGPPWRMLDPGGNPVDATSGAGSLTAVHRPPGAGLGFFSPSGPVGLTVTRPVSAGGVPLLATPQALAALRLRVGQQTSLDLPGGAVDARIAGTVAAVPGSSDGSALLVDFASASALLFHRYGAVRAPQEWWVATEPGRHAAAAGTVAGLAGVRLLDRRVLAGEAGRDPYGVGARAALFAAALGAVLLAAVGIGVDVRATARRRVIELAVLHTLGAGPRLLARSLIAEQAFLAGIGVAVGLLVGVVVAAAMAPLVILTPAAGRPVPAPLLTFDWPPVLATTAGLFGLALALSALVAVTMRQRLAAAQLRIGEDR